MKIITSHMPPPIPIRDFDWTAYVDGEYDIGQPLGEGKTEADAIADLLEKLAERDDG